MTSPLAFHHGRVVHSMDHYVLDLHNSGERTAYLSLYSIGLMESVGTGRVALLRVSDANRHIDLCIAETEELGRRMQQRLTKIRVDRVPDAGVATPIEVGSFHLTAGPDTNVAEWTVVWGQHRIEARWLTDSAPFWVSAPAGTFHPERDYVASLSSHWAAELSLDGEPVNGTPILHDWFTEVLGRRFSSSHIALAEVALDPA